MRRSCREVEDNAISLFIFKGNCGVNASVDCLNTLLALSDKWWMILRISSSESELNMVATGKGVYCSQYTLIELIQMQLELSCLSELAVLLI